MSYLHSWKENICIITFNGDVDGAQLAACANILIGDSRFNSLKCVALDFLSIRKLDITKFDLKLLSTFDRTSSRWNKYLKLAGITRDKFTREMFLEYGELMMDTHWEVRLFENTEDAAKWCSGEGK